MKARRLTLAILLLIGSSALGNVGIFGGSGHTLELAKSEQVQLVSEEVTIAPVPGVRAERDQVAYRCEFMLKNLSSEEVTAQVGFPVDGLLYEDDSLDETERVLAYHFIARDDRTTYHVRYVHREAPAKYPELFVWKMTFSPQETKRLHIAYILPMSVATAGTARQQEGSPESVAPTYGRPWYAALEPCVYEQLTYITETGVSWKGPLEEATFCVETFSLSNWMSQRSTPFLAAVDPPPGSSQPQQLYSMKVGLTYLQKSPGDWKCNLEQGTVTWKSRNYKPGEPIRFAWFGTALPATPDDGAFLVQQLMGNNPKRAEVLELSEIVAAFHGIPPKTDTVKKFVERQVWYHPDNRLRRSELTEEQRATLTRLEAIAEENR